MSTKRFKIHATNFMPFELRMKQQQHRTQIAKANIANVTQMKKAPTIQKYTYSTLNVANLAH